MPLWRKTQVGQKNQVLDALQIPKWKGHFSGAVRAIQKHWQSSRSGRRSVRCRVRYKGDHSIANNVMQAVRKR